MLNLNTIFHPFQDQEDTYCWKFATEDFECWIWMGKHSTPQGKKVKPNDCTALSFRIVPALMGKFKRLNLYKSSEMLAVFGHELSTYPYGFDGSANQGANVPIEIVRDIVEKVIRFTNPMPLDAGDGE